MLYTFIGVSIGGLIFYIIALINHISFKNDSWGHSWGPLFVLLGCCIGGAMGFSMGSTLFLSGNYFLPFETLAKKSVANSCQNLQ